MASYFDDRTGLSPPAADPTGGFFRDYGDLMRQASRQRMFGGLAQLGAGLMQAGAGGPYGSQQQGLSNAFQGFNQAATLDPMDMVRARYMMGQMEAQQGAAAGKAATAAAQQRVQGRLAAGETMEAIMASPEGRADMAAAGEMDVLTRKQPDILNPEVEAARIRIAQASRPVTNVNLPGEQETERAKAYGKGVGEFYADEYTAIQGAAKKARSETARMNAQESLLAKTYTGLGAPSVQQLRKLSKALGVEGMEDVIASGEAGQALADEFALQMRDTSGGAGLPGAASDADREFLRGMSGGMTMTKEGRKTLFEVRRRLNRRNIDIAREAREYSQENGSIDEGFYDLLDRKYASDPTSDMFTDLRESAAPDADLSGLSDTDLIGVDIEAMTDDQATAWEAEMNRRGL